MSTLSPDATATATEPAATATSTSPPSPASTGLAIALPQRDVAIEGRLDAASALRLRVPVTEAIQDGPAMVLIDVSAVTQVTASGLAGMLELLRLARARGGELRLYGTSQAVADAQLVAQLTQVSRVYPGRQDALDAVPSRVPPTARTRSRRRARHAKRATLEARLVADARQGLLFPEVEGIGTSQPAQTVPPAHAKPVT